MDWSKQADKKIWSTEILGIAIWMAVTLITRQIGRYWLDYICLGPCKDGGDT